MSVFLESLREIVAGKLPATAGWQPALPKVFSAPPIM
jgi:hypothetical protein